MGGRPGGVVEMSYCIIMRLEASLMSFGGPLTDNFCGTQAFPGISLLTGLLGNALGYKHEEWADLNSLQGRIRYAVRLERKGQKVRDYQIADLGQDHMDFRLQGWTTRGRIEERGGGNKFEKHIRYRDYYAGSAFLVAFTLIEADEIEMKSLEQAIQYPRRPLFIGRKCCLPAYPIFHGMVVAKTPLHAIARMPRMSWGEYEAEYLSVWWDPRGVDKTEFPNEIDSIHQRNFQLTDERDWKNQIHQGERSMVFGRLHVQNVGDRT